MNKLIKKFFDIINLQLSARLGIRITRNVSFANSIRTFDPVAYKIILGVKDRTMTDENRLYNAIVATRYISENRIPGDIVECGVWRGGSMMAIASTLITLSDTTRSLYLYDTFQGMTKPSRFDIRLDGRSAKDLLGESVKQNKKEFEGGVIAFASLQDVKAGMSSTKYPEKQIAYEVGKVEKTLKATSHKSLSLVRLDTDWYESTKHELEVLWPKLISGGVLIIDDYDHWTGARKATDEYFEKLSVRPLFMAMNSGRILIKP